MPIAAAAAIGLALSAAKGDPQPVSVKDWGRVTTPVYGSHETAAAGRYKTAELFAGPNKFGSYYTAVLPNGRVVRPAGLTVQAGYNPMGVAVTPDGKYIVVSDDGEKLARTTSMRDRRIIGGYALTILDASTMRMVGQIQSGKFFIGIQVTGTGPYRIWASGGADNDVKAFDFTPGRPLPSAPSITTVIEPITPADRGYVSHYASSPSADAPSGRKNRRTRETAITYPAGCALSPDGRYLYVACNGDNSLAIIDTGSGKVIRQIAVGYFPYGVSVSDDGARVYVANWGVTEYKFKNPIYDSSGALVDVKPIPGNQPDGFYAPRTSTPLNSAGKARTSSIFIVNVPGANPANASFARSVYLGQPGGLDALNHVGETHPSASAIVGRGADQVMYVLKSNDDSIAMIRIAAGARLPDFALDTVRVAGSDHRIAGAYPNAIAVSPDRRRAYVAEAGLNAVAVLDTTAPQAPRLLGRIGTCWYPTAVAVSPNGKQLYVASARGVAEDINPATKSNPLATGLISYSGDTAPGGFRGGMDSNTIFGTLQKIDLSAARPQAADAIRDSFLVQAAGRMDASVVPLGGKPSDRIKHVIFILQENKTFDSMLGAESKHLGPYASQTFNQENGSPYTSAQYGEVDPNTRLLSRTFATGVNYYSDSEESDAGHQFCSSGTASDYTEKTLLVKNGRGLLSNKNFDPEDYPESGYIFNNAARNGVSFKDYGDMLRIAGSDNGGSADPLVDDPASGKSGFPETWNPLKNTGDTQSATRGLGQSYIMAIPVLGVLGGRNAGGEPRLDRNYPGYDFNISDQRRARTFCADFDRMLAAGTLPRLLWVYLPNDHTGAVSDDNDQPTAPQQVGDGDTALGMVVEHIMASRIWYNRSNNTGAAIFMTFDDAQGTKDHIHPHRTPLIIASPFVKPGYLATRHYSSASIVKTEELILGLPPNNLGDLFATDLRDVFQSRPNGIALPPGSFSRTCRYQPTPEGRRIWSYAVKLDCSGPDRDSNRLGVLAELSMRADRLHHAAQAQGGLRRQAYRRRQAELLAQARILVHEAPARDDDD